MPEEFYIGSESDSNEELRHLHDENLALTLVIQNGFHGRVEPHKASHDAVVKLSEANIKAYIASHKKTVYAGVYARKFDLKNMIKGRADLFAESRDDEASFINT